jgi:hypothetical protein
MSKDGDVECCKALIAAAGRKNITLVTAAELSEEAFATRCASARSLQENDPSLIDEAAWTSPPVRVEEGWHIVGAPAPTASSSSYSGGSSSARRPIRTSRAIDLRTPGKSASRQLLSLGPQESEICLPSICLLLLLWYALA